jgi:hypothetical protein
MKDLERRMDKRVNEKMKDVKGYQPMTIAEKLGCD